MKERIGIYAENENIKYELKLFEGGKPTPAFLGLLVAELCIDAAIALLIYNIARCIGKR